MNKFNYLPAFALAAVMTACGSGNSTSQENDSLANNPLLKESDLPYQAPDFKIIKDSHFQPAMEAAMKEHISEIEQIANNSEAPTFDNTFVAIEKTGKTLSRVYGVFNLLTGANTNSELQKIEEEQAPKLAAHMDAIYLNNNLFQRVKTIYNKLGSLNLDSESNRLVEYYYQKFELAGANLSEESKTQLKKLNEEEAQLSAIFTNRLLAATKAGALIIDDESKLAGFSDNDIKAFEQVPDAESTGKKFIIPLQNTTQQPVLQSLSNREVRHEIFMHSVKRAEKGDSTDTRAIIARIAIIRAQQANLLGFENFAAWKLQDQMAKTPKAANDFLSKLVPAAKAKALNEAADIQKVIDQQNGGFKLEPWDWDFYAEQVRKAKYDLDESQMKPYFELNKVVESGVFYAAQKLYGITFKERHDIPVYQEDVRVFELFNEDSTAIGLFYCDYFKRDNKSGGAWMGNIIEQSKLLNTKPVIYNVCNFTKPAAGQPALISFDDVTTLFHEFGHALHGFFANQQYQSLSGTNVARDFVELPSQINEHWSVYPEVFENYAVHYKTGEPMPQELVDKMRKAATFNQGYSLTEVLAAAGLDMQWHTISPDCSINDVNQFESEALNRFGLNLSQVPPRYSSTYFMHIWGHGYAAGYYAYLWAEMLDNDAFAWFQENGGLTRENGQRFRDMILSRGNTEDFGKMFKDFRGQEPNINPMLKHRGLMD